MTARATYAFVCAGVLACATPPPPIRAASHATAPTVRDRLEDACGPCHPGEHGRPSVDRMVSDVTLARRSLQRISAGQMPPSGLPFEARKPLIHSLCELASHDPARCYDVYTLGRLPSLMRSPGELSGDIQSRWQFSDPVAGSLDEGLSSASSQPSYATPTTDAILLTGAIAGCTELNKNDTTLDVDECVRSIIARDFIRALEPAK
jgi:hypothetical protein